MSGTNDERPDEVVLVDAHVSQLAVARHRVSAALDAEQPDANSRFLVAINEVLTNAISVHRRLGETKPITMTIRHEPLTVTIADHGDGVGVAWPASMPGRDAISGRGLAIAHQFCPDMTVQTGSRGTSVTLPFVVTGG